MKFEHGIRDDHAPRFSECFVGFESSRKPTFFYEMFKKRQKTKNIAQFHQKYSPRRIYERIGWFDSICLHKMLVCGIFIHKWNQSIYPSIQIGVFWLKTNIIEIQMLFSDKKRKAKFIFRSFDIVWTSFLESMSISSSNA